MATSTVAVICLTFACVMAGGNAQNFATINSKLLRVNAHQNFFADELETLRKSLSEGMQWFWFQNLNLQSSELKDKSRNISEECKAGVDRILNSTDPATGLPLIVRMIDAMGKPGAGYFEGNIYASGAYDECLDIGPGESEYCVGDVALNASDIESPVPLSWKFGMCVPHGCTPGDIALAVDEVTNGLLNANASKLSCVSTRKPPFTAGAIIMIIACFLLVVLVCAASVFDFTLQWICSTEHTSTTDIQDEESSMTAKKVLKHKKFVEIVTAFSLFKVLPQILSTKQPPSAITSINGLRVISMFWVILAHTHFSVLLTGLDSILRLTSTLLRFSFQVIGNTYFAVDSFFVLSGLLVTYLSMHQMKRKRDIFPSCHTTSIATCNSLQHMPSFCSLFGF